MKSTKQTQKELLRQLLDVFFAKFFESEYPA